MLKQKSQRQLLLSIGKSLPVVLLAGLTLFTIAGCDSFFHSNKTHTLKSESGETIDLNDSTVKQYVEEWHDAKPSIERLTKMETDLNFLLSEVSKMSDLNQTPGLANQQGRESVITIANKPSAGTTAATGAASAGTSKATTNTLLTTTITPPPFRTTESSGLVMGNGNSAGMATSASMGPSMGVGTMPFDPGNSLCPEAYANSYLKTLAIANFPRVQVNSSKFGQLSQVEQHLPLLIGANLHNRHSLIIPAYIPASFTSADSRGEIATAAQAISVARQNRVQFMVTGEVDDMSLNSPDNVQNPGIFRQAMNSTIDLFHVDTSLDKRDRVFSFTLQVRDGITGQLVFNNQYKTSGQWNVPPSTEMGFASPRFWQTDYGKKIQQLVASASDDLASSIRCQPYISRVDARPYQQQVVIQSGNNNGLRTGDSFDLYQLVYQPVTGEYQQFDTRLIKRNGRVYLTEIYPSHSIGQVVDDTLSGGQYIVKAQ